MTRLEKRLLSAVSKASADFGLVEANDRIMVAVSGGKDSHALSSGGVPRFRSRS